LLEGGGARNGAQHQEEHWKSGKESVERDGLRLRDAAGKDSAHCAVEPLKEWRHSLGFHTSNRKREQDSPIPVVWRASQMKL